MRVRAADERGMQQAGPLKSWGPGRRVQVGREPASPEQHEEVGATEGQMDLEVGDEQAGDEQVLVVESREGEGDSDGEENVDVVD